MKMSKSKRKTTSAGSAGALLGGSDFPQLRDKPLKARVSQDLSCS